MDKTLIRYHKGLWAVKFWEQDKGIDLIIWEMGGNFVVMSIVSELGLDSLGCGYIAESKHAHFLKMQFELKF